MNKSTNHYQRLIGIVALLLVLTKTSGAQSVWMADDEVKSAVGFEVMIPSIDEIFGSEFPTSVFELYGIIELNANISAKLSLPVSHYSTSNSFAGDISETAIGNPYLGVVIREASENLDVELGIRLPFAPDDNTGLVTGLLVENYDFGVYLPETLSFSTSLKYHNENESGLIVKGGGGPDIVKPSNGGDVELLLNYYGQALYGMNKLGVGVGFTGLLIVSEADLSFGDRTVHNFGITGSYNVNSSVIGAFISVPLDDDLNDTLNFVMGLNLTLGL